MHISVQQMPNVMPTLGWTNNLVGLTVFSKLWVEFLQFSTTPAFQKASENSNLAILYISVAGMPRIDLKKGSVISI